MRFRPPKRFEELRQTLLWASKAVGVNCYLVGGLLRDLLTGCEAEEADVVVEGNSRKVAEAVAGRISSSVVPLDPKGGGYRIPHPFGLRYLDLVQAEGGSIEHDLLKRDFTVDALALSVEVGPEFGERDLLDPTGGLMDLKQSTVRMVSEENLQADPIRLLRGWRLKWQLKFQFEPETEASISKLAPLLRKEAKERIREELFKVLEMETSPEALREALSLGLLFPIIPELEPLRDVPPDGYHHLDGLSHSLETVSKVKVALSEGALGPVMEKVVEELGKPVGHGSSRLSRLRFCALVHDVGKPQTAERDEEGWLHFYGHERVGAKMVREIAERLRFTTKDAEAVEKIIKAHMRPGQLALQPMVSERAKVRVFRNLGDLTLEVLVLSYADRLAACGPELEGWMVERQLGLIRELCQKFFSWREMKGRERLITGHEVMGRYGLEPGPLVGEILKRVEEEQFSRGLKTKEEAFKVADEIVQRLGALRQDELAQKS